MAVEIKWKVLTLFNAAPARAQLFGTHCAIKLRDLKVEVTQRAGAQTLCIGATDVALRDPSNAEFSALLDMLPKHPKKDV